MTNMQLIQYILQSISRSMATQYSSFQFISCYSVLFHLCLCIFITHFTPYSSLFTFTPYSLLHLIHLYLPLHLIQ